MASSPWTPVDLQSVNSQFRVYERLLHGSTPGAGGTGQPATEHATRRLLDDIDGLVPFLVQPLLEVEAAILDFELHRLAAFPDRAFQRTVLVGLGRQRVHLLLLALEGEGRRRLLQWSLPVESAPIGVTFQVVGHLDAVEAIVVCSDGQGARQYRIDVSEDNEVAVLSRRRQVSAGLVGIGVNAAPAMDGVQTEVRRVRNHENRPIYQLLARAAAHESWRLIHRAAHPLHHPVFDGRTLYFISRANEVCCVEDPFGNSTAHPRTLISLDTPSPVQALLLRRQGEHQTLLAAMADGMIFALDPATGSPRWKHDTGRGLVAATLAGRERSRLVTTSPDGLLVFHEFSDIDRVERRIETLLTKTNIPLEHLLTACLPDTATTGADRGTQGRAESGPDSKRTGAPTPSSPDAPPRLERPGGRPYLCMLLIERMLREASLSDDRLELVRQGLIRLFFDAAWTSDDLQSVVVRFLTLLFHSTVQDLTRTHPEGVPVDDVRLDMLFGVLAIIGPASHGDARRRVERLLRRLQHQWLPRETFDQYRARAPQVLSPWPHMSPNWGQGTQEELRAAQDAGSWDEKVKHLRRAALFAWRRHTHPLSRTISLHGVRRAVRILERTPSSTEDPQIPVRLAALLDTGIQVFQIHPSFEIPEPTAFQPFPDAVALASMPRPGGETLLAAATNDRLALFAVNRSSGQTRIRSLANPALPLDEPVTALTLLELPHGSSTQPVVVIGQADGRLSVVAVEMEEQTEGGLTARLGVSPLLEAHLSAPVQHVILARWPRDPSLLVDGAAELLVYSDLRFEHGRLECSRSALSMGAPVTAVTVARLRTTGQGRPTRLLLVGLANGFVLAFGEPTSPSNDPELCWLYQSPRGITDLCHVVVAGEDRFVAAADDGTLLLLKNGEVLASTVVERYPTGLVPFRFPGLARDHLLVSSRAGTATVIEVVAGDPREAVEPIVRQIADLISEPTARHLATRTRDPASLALAAFWQGRHSVRTLVGFLERQGPILLGNRQTARALVGTLLEGLDREPGERTRAYECLRSLLGSGPGPTPVRAHVIQALGLLLNRLEDEEATLLLSTYGLSELPVGRAYVKALEHLWYRHRNRGVDNLFWWRALHHLAAQSRGKLSQRHILPHVGSFCRRLLGLHRGNALQALGTLRGLEKHNLRLAEWVCEALSLPHVVDDPVARMVVRQYRLLLLASTASAIERALRDWRDLLEDLEDVLPGAPDERRAVEDILEAFSYHEYDQYSRFLVDDPEFLPSFRTDPMAHQPLLRAFETVRAKLLAAVPPIPTERDDTSRFHDRLQVLVAHSETLLGFKQRWKQDATLEQRIVAAVVNRWRQRILRPEIRRLQDAVHLEVREVRVVEVDDEVAEVSALIHNLGGHPLEGVWVGLHPDEQAPYLWEGPASWCQGPISFGQAVTYRTEILVDGKMERLTLTFEIRTPDQDDEEDPQRIPVTVPLIRSTPEPGAREPGSWKEKAPITFDALLQRLRHAESGQAFCLLGEDTRRTQDLAMDLSTALARGVRPSRRSVVLLDLTSLIARARRADEGGPPAWWLTSRLARELLTRRLIDQAPERGTLRADPAAVLEQVLYQAVESAESLWVMFLKTSRAFASLPGDAASEIIRWLSDLVDHPSHKVHLLLVMDRATLTRIALPPSPFAGRVHPIDIDLPYPAGNPRSREEHLNRAREILDRSRVVVSRPILRKLVAHAGWNLSIVQVLAESLANYRAESWLGWGADERTVQGEPEELHLFLQKVLPTLTRPFKERVRTLPFLHRLALAAVGSARTRVGRKDLRSGMILADDVMTRVRAKGNRSKRLYAANAVLFQGDVKYLRVTVGAVRGHLQAGLFRSLDYRCALSHLLAVMDVERLMSDLDTLGLVRRVSGFDEPCYAVAIPLFRRWLAANHPFEPGEEATLRHRLLEAEDVAGRIPLSLYPVLQRRLGSKGQVKDFLVFLGLLPGSGPQASEVLESAVSRWERLVSLARRFRAWSEKPGTETFRNLVREWASLFSVESSNLREEHIDGLQAFTLDLSSLRIPRLSRARVFGAPDGVTFLEMEHLREIVQRADLAEPSDEPGSHGIGFIFERKGGPDSGWGEETMSSERELLGERLLRLTERRLAHVALARDGRRAFLDLLTDAGFQFKHISPYQLVGPLMGRAMDVLFVGRESEIDEILRHPDKAFAVVGSRKIGKTSLLLKIRELLMTSLGERARVIYLDCARLDPDAVWREIGRSLQGPDLDPGRARLQLTERLKHGRHPVVLLLDEIDGIYDHPGEAAEREAETLMWNLRSLVNAGVLRLVMAGYVKVHELRHNPRSAFHNFTTFIRLGALSLEAARSLVRNPLGALDIELASQGLLDMVVERTYRVPWIIQLFCDQLIARLDERLARERRLDRRIQREDVDGVAVQIEEQLYTHFTSPRVMTQAQQLILLTMVAAGIDRFTEDELRTVLESEFGPEIWRIIPFDSLHRALDNLTLTLALTVQDGVYSFPLDMYPSVIRNRLGDVRPRVRRIHEELSRT